MPGDTACQKSLFDKLADGEASSPATAAIHAAATIGIRVVQSPLMLSLRFSTGCLLTLRIHAFCDHGKVSRLFGVQQGNALKTFIFRAFPRHIAAA